LVAKTIGVVAMLRSALAPLADHISVAFIYGSMARQEDVAESDIDLMVVGRARLEDVLTRLGRIEASLRRPVNTTVYSPAEFKRKLASGNHFLNSVMRGEKVFLIGDGSDLKEMGGIRVAKSRSD
jgi:Nucleotidyltransferase domain.